MKAVFERMGVLEIRNNMVTFAVVKHLKTITMTKITVLSTDINVVTIHHEDYICLTDMLKAKDGDFFISDWLRNRNTLEYLGIWEKLYNPDFNYGEFAIIRNQ